MIHNNFFMYMNINYIDRIITFVHSYHTKMILGIFWIISKNKKLPTSYQYFKTAVWMTCHISINQKLLSKNMAYFCDTSITKVSTTIKLVNQTEICITKMGNYQIKNGILSQELQKVIKKSKIRPKKSILKLSVKNGQA